MRSSFPYIRVERNDNAFAAVQLDADCACLRRSFVHARRSARDIDFVLKSPWKVVFDIPPHVAKMISEYRDRILPKIIGHRHERLFAASWPGGPANVKIR
jgi:hypothetical protein